MQDARSQFGREAEKYLASTTHSDAAELGYLVRFASPKGGPVLDVATGAGHTAHAFAPYASRVVATDVTPEMLAIVERESTQRRLGNVETALMPAESLDVADESFEGVTCRLAPHHFHDVVAFLSEVFRVLRPGGWFLLVDTVGIEGDAKADADLDRFERLRDPSHVRNYTPEAWRSMIEAAGLCVERFEVGSRTQNLGSWLDRMSVEEPARSQVRDILVNSAGALRDYLLPSGDGPGLGFTLRHVIALGRKPT